MTVMPPIDLRLLSRTRGVLPQIMQSELAECGLACIAMIARYHGHDVDMLALRRKFPGSLKGVDLARLVEMAAALDLSARALRIELNDLKRVQGPCILHWDLDHFVVLKQATRSGIVIHDPGFGVRSLTWDEASRSFTGIALDVQPSTSFEAISDRVHISIAALVGRVAGIKRALGFIALLALVLEVCVIAAPFYAQWVVDQVLLSADRDLLTVLFVSFILLSLFQVVFFAARSWAGVWFGANLNLQWSGRVFGKLLELPLSWFSRRHVGDVMSRFASMQSIQRTISTQFVEGILDGVMSLAILAILMVYSIKLTAVGVGFFAIYLLLRYGIFRWMRRATEEQVVQAARLQSELMEAVRGAQSIKLNGSYAERRSRFANVLVATTNRDVEVQKIGVIYNSVRQWLIMASRIFIIWIAATQVLDGSFSTGMLVAFVAYADIFATRVSQLIDRIMEWRMLGLHAERVADVVLSEPEADLVTEHAGSIPDFSLQLRSVGFRYAPAEPRVLDGLDLYVEEGESVALVGPSGCGKATLARIMLGLIQPEDGQVLLGGIDIRHIGLQKYRSFVGAVMQDDQLFAGSIADNIGFFSHSADPERVEQAARLAAVHEDIVRMPMGYGSLVGDMGSALSGGQKQRILLARALYRRPRVLILDEATSHLDVDREAEVNRAIAGLRITRIIVAHRPETIRSADRVIEFPAGVSCGPRRSSRA